MSVTLQVVMELEKATAETISDGSQSQWPVESTSLCLELQNIKEQHGLGWKINLIKSSFRRKKFDWRAKVFPLFRSLVLLIHHSFFVRISKRRYNFFKNVFFLSQHDAGQHSIREVH